MSTRDAENERDQVLVCSIKGTRGLLVHSTEAMKKPKSKKIKSSEHNTEEEARDCLYLNEAGKSCVPSMALLSAMKKGAASMKKGGAGKMTLKNFVFSGLSITPDLIELTPQEYEVDIRPVVVQRARIMRARPLYKKWDLTFEITILDSQTWDAGMVRQVLEEAGRYQGVLDFRPLFGTFEVVSMIDKVTGKEIK